MRSISSTCAVALAWLLLTGVAHAAGETDEHKDTQKQVLAPFYTSSQFDAPPAGSYALPDLGPAADGEVLDARGRPQRLHALFGDDKVVLLSFIYSTCSDINGCPLATAVLYRVIQKLRDDPQLGERLRIVSLSFDPTYDTPDVMGLYGSGFQAEGDWRFLTTKSQQQLQPILERYGQSVIRDIDDKGEPMPSFSHILRVFLIDPEKRIRNIYSVSFLNPDLLINDAKTVLNLPDSSRADGRMAHNSVATLSKPGDDKRGYETADYETASHDLVQRRGQQADLFELASNPPLGLPAVPQPADNPLTRERIQLGRRLFFDRRLSLNDTFSCAMCHVPEQGFTSNELATAVGFEGRSVRRNTPTLYNSAYLTKLFHDGRETTLEQQVWSPLLAHNEMANPSIGAVIEKIRRTPDYAGLFEAAFDGKGPSMETVGMALAAYERTLVSANSAFDRWHFGGDLGALNPAAKRGFALFTGKAGCASCHSVQSEHALFTDNALHNTGVGYRESMGIRSEKQRVLVAPGVEIEVDRDIIDQVSEPAPADVGLYEVTQNPHDRWKYRTPSLRNVALTAPYMHNGSMSSLREVIAFYNDGGVENELLDPRIRPLGLADEEIDDLLAFLHSLTGDSVDTIVSDAFAAPVGDITKNDPHWAHKKLADD